MRSRSMAAVACRPAMVFTSMGKKVMMTTTAALDCQSKPNHMTMIGATPTMGRAETKLPSGSRPRCRKGRSEEHTSELQSLMRISYAVFCLKKKKQQTTVGTNNINKHGKERQHTQ